MRVSGWRRAFTGRHRHRNRALGVLIALVIVLLADAAVLDLRIDTIDLRMPTGGDGETFVLVGSDSRVELPPGTSPSAFGDSTEVPGQRADVVLVVHRRPDGSSSTVSVPRDLLINGSAGAPVRLALTFGDSPQALVDGLCRTLGIRTDHLVVIDFEAFDTVVDGLGGVRIDLPAPLRDTWTGLQLNRTGPITLTGEQALALVRSRHPEELRAGVWVPLAGGAERRTDWAGVVFAGLRGSAGTLWKNPVRLQQVAWRTTGVLTTDNRTGVWDLRTLASSTGTPVDLPGRRLSPDALALVPDHNTFATLSAAGFGRDCRPTG